ncbi:esterase-like activity of phytase family protein [Microbaculum marinum]|uniref:Esterase-like activity of phytase family protein n=1 Tax=Microbaculum marinum TaxID=1764581 RepID=A0AAW9RS72_9HYPH
MRILVAIGFFAAAVLPAAAQQEFTATLTGHAVLPADTLVPAPADAPESVKTSGKFAGKTPVRAADAPGDGPSLPLNGQPVQGFSGIRKLDDGTFLVLTDNGFGAKLNSPDAMLMFHHVTPDFETGEVEILKTTFLNDPDKVVPFLIAGEASDKRYLTGWDFDIEGFQPVGDKIFIGDEFGPYIIVVDRETGRVEEFFETFLGDKKVQSPDHYEFRLSDPHADAPAVNLKRSRGYEGFAASVDGKTLYPLLEGPIWDADSKSYEKVDGTEALRILEFDVAGRKFTGRSWLYPLEADGNAIGDFNMIDETRGLVIERDNGQGDAELACKDGATDGCFTSPAKLKRVYLINMDGVADGEPVKKVGYIDLLNIQDPDGIARIGKREDGRFTFPFVTIEDVDRIDETHIIVANDNNYPFSKGRSASELDNNEFVTLEVGEFLKAK